ncbi:MAG: hypothetical protein N2327_08195 [Caldimicrobium sp.]|nr:hypothetical protein [Caldimicrobium sp.]MCX7874388.1 hypothetical protein [Caldimicrobium sp.]MDW8094026.1 hypothetical protein [Caldimicrobium sp.]
MVGGITAKGVDAYTCNYVFLDGIRRYVWVAKDVVSRFGFAYVE